MRIVIIGAGFTGVQLAKLLINEKNTVAIIDNDENNVRHVSNQLDCTVMLAATMRTTSIRRPQKRATRIRSAESTDRCTASIT